MDGYAVWLALVAAVFWSISAVFGKLVMQEMKPVSVLVIVGILYAIILAGIGAIWWKDISYDVHKIMQSPKLFGCIMGLILAGFLIPYYIYYTLMKNHPSYLVVALTYTVPVFTIIWAYFVLRENMNIWAGLGVVMIVAGALIAVANE